MTFNGFSFFEAKIDQTYLFFIENNTQKKTTPVIQWTTALTWPAVLAADNVLTQSHFACVAPVMSHCSWESADVPRKSRKQGLRSNNERQSQAAGCWDNRPTFFLALSHGSFQVALSLR